MRWLAVMVLLSAGCFEAPRDGGEPLDGPGVRTTFHTDDDYACSAPLIVQDGCVSVRLPEAESQCSGLSEAYISCAVSMKWSAAVGAYPGARLVASVSGAHNDTVECDPGTTGCALLGNFTLTQRFQGPGEAAHWNLTFGAVLEKSPPGTPDYFEVDSRLVLET
jgi:hypothetical protein